MDSLLKLKKVENSDDVVNLRRLYNNVENCVRNLKCLDVETSTYGCLLIPIFKARLPDDLILLIPRKFEGNVWTLERLLKCISDELIAKETCGSIFNSKTKSHSNGTSKRGQYTANSLLSENGDFRKDRNRCFIVTVKTTLRCSVEKCLMQSHVFLLCLKRGHVFKNYASS